MMDRRTLLRGLVGVIAAPAIVRATSLMPVKAWWGIDLGSAAGDYTATIPYEPPSPEFLKVLRRCREMMQKQVIQTDDGPFYAFVTGEQWGDLQLKDLRGYA